MQLVYYKTKQFSVNRKNFKITLILSTFIEYMFLYIRIVLGLCSAILS